MTSPRALLSALLLASVIVAPAFGAERRCMPDGASFPAGWTTPFPAHRVIGNLYAVGMEDLSVFLITTPAGHILINSGVDGSEVPIRENVESLGFHLEDVKILLTMQAHFDHTAALAEIQQLTGAEMWATEKDARVLADGGKSDAHFGECVDMRFPPVRVDHILTDGEVIELGGMHITTHLHPGHTEGSSSYTFTHNEDGRSYRVAIANMGTINPGKQLVVHPTYPGVAEDFAETYRRQKAMPVDVWVAAHGSQYHLLDKYQPGQPYDPETFVDPQGYLAEVTRLEEIYLEQLETERRSAQ